MNDPEKCSRVEKSEMLEEKDREKDQKRQLCRPKLKKLNPAKKYEKAERKLNKRNHKRMQGFLKCVRGTHKRKLTNDSRIQMHHRQRRRLRSMKNTKREPKKQLGKFCYS